MNRIGAVAAVALCASLALMTGCAPASKPVRASAPPLKPPLTASQTIGGVLVSVETTTSRAAVSAYDGLQLADPGGTQKLAYVLGTATNSSNATVAVSGTPAIVYDTDGSKLQRWNSIRVVLTASGRPVLARLVKHWYREADGVGPGGKVIYLVGYKRPFSQAGPIEVVWTLGGGRLYSFKLSSP